ncbi:hypothetical protein [Chlamydia sp. 17-3921]|uniref:hypothetical protein n=1 Tax=Chlamydia sp. 17-3921 TaxID=2675798 RepID=UPI001917FCA5|nr:hypothetical protein [Chlamydia sp. 17-3921]
MKSLVFFAILLAMPSVEAARKVQATTLPHTKQTSKPVLKKPQRKSSNPGSNSVKKFSQQQSRKKPQQKSKRKSSLQTNTSLTWTSYSGAGYTIRFPQTWQCIDDKAQLPEKLDAVFIGRGSGSLTPTINLAQEITSKTPSEYIEEILSYHKTKDSTLESSIFARIQSPSGEFTIIKTEKNSSWGRVYCLQAVAVLNHSAYIFTSTSTLEDYPELSLIFLKTVASFELDANEILSGTSVLEEALKKFEKETQAN